DRARLRADPGRRVDLHRCRPRDLCGTDAVRFPAPAPERGHLDGTGARRVDLPRRPDRVPALALDPRPRQLIWSEVCQVARLEGRLRAFLFGGESAAAVVDALCRG